MPLHGGCVLHTPEVHDGRHNEEIEPGPSPVHAQPPNGLEVVHGCPRLGHGTAPRVFDDGTKGEPMGIGDHFGQERQSLTDDERGHKDFGGGGGPAVGRQVQEAK